MLQQKKKRALPSTTTSGPSLLPSNDQQVFKTNIIAELPYILKNAIEQVENKHSITGSITKEALAYVILQNELFVWSIDKPQSCDRLILPADDLNENQITVFRNPQNNDQFSAFCCTNFGAVRFWSQTTKPNQSHEISIEGYNYNDISISVAECSPFGIVVGNSLGNIHLVSIRQGSLSIKKINKASNMLSYLYFSKPSPVISVVSSAPINSQQQQQQGNIRGIFVLTESTLFKYEISNSHEKIVLEYPYTNEFAKCFTGIRDIKTIGLYVQTHNDPNTLETTETLNLLHYTIEQTPKPNHSKVTFYILKLDISQNKVIMSAQRGIFSPKLEILNNEIKNLKLSKLYSKDSKYYLIWKDRIHFTSSAAESKVKVDSIVCSGTHQDHLYLLNLESGISNFDIKPFNNDLFIKKERSKEEKSLNQPIIFDLSQSPDQSTLKTNIIFKTLNSISLKQQNKTTSNLEECKSIVAFENVIKQVSKLILDQQPKSKFWASDDSNSLGNLGSDISLQLKQQLEDKKKRHAFLLKCLSEFDFTNSKLSDETIDYLKRNALKIDATIDIREYQTTYANDGGFMSSLIQNLVSERKPNWKNDGMNVFELFYSNVSGIDQLLQSITSKMKLNDSNKNLDVVVKIKELMESATIFHKIIQLFPINYYFYEISLSNPNENIHSLLQKLIECIFSFIAVDLASTPFNLVAKELPNFENQLFNILYDMVSLFLSSWKLKDTSSFQTGKTYYITPFVKKQKYQQALNLAKLFDDNQSIINIYISDTDNQQTQIQNVHQSLTSLLNNPQQLESIYSYMIEKGLISELLQMPNPFNDSISGYLKRYPQYQWIHSLRIGNYSKSSEILKTNANSENNLKKKKIQYSLSKLALFCDPKYNNGVFEKSEIEINSHINLINHEIKSGLKTYLNINNYLENILANGITFESLEQCLIVVEDSKDSLSQDSIFEIYCEILKLAMEYSNWREIKSHAVSDLQFDSDLQSTIFYRLAILLPFDIIGQLFESAGEKYYKSIESKLSQSEKRQIGNILSRSLELLTK